MKTFKTPETVREYQRKKQAERRLKNKQAGIPRKRNKLAPILTIIQIHKTTKNRLIEVGEKGDTYDQIIQRLLDLYMSDDHGNIQRLLELYESDDHDNH